MTRKRKRAGTKKTPTKEGWFSPDVRDKALVASGRCCSICHKFCGLKIELHHIVHKSEGGEDTFENCIPLCFDCHSDMRSYDHKHPKGTKYRPAELKKHRNSWYRKVQKNDPVKQVVASYSLTVEQRKVLAAKLKGYSGEHSNVKILFADVKNKSFAEMLLSVFQASNWRNTYLNNVAQQPYRSEYIQDIEVSGHNKHFVEAISEVLRDVGLTTVRTKIDPLQFDQSNPKWNWAQHKIKIMIGHEA